MTQAIVTRTAADVPVEDVKALASRILNNKPLFPDDMSDQQAAELAMIALAYGLDPFADEITLYEGKPLVTLIGRVRKVSEHPQFDGIEYTRPANEAEREAFRVTPTEDMWVAAVWRKDRRFPFVGYGRAGGAYERNALVTGSKRTGYNPQRGPELARKRALVNAMRLGFSMPLPVAIEGADDGYVQARVIDRGSGEIIDGEVVPESPPGITPDQIKAIHASAHELGLTDEAYRARLMAMFGCKSSLELDAGQAQAAIAAFTAEHAAEEERARGRVAMESITLADDDDAWDLAPAEIIPVGPEHIDVAAVARAEIGGELQSVPEQAALDRYASALTRGSQLGLDLAPFAIRADDVSARQLDEMDAKLRELIARNEPKERLGGM